MNWEQIVKEARSANSILEHEVQNLIIFADNQASEADKKTFVEWAKGGLDINTSMTDPGDHFECAEGMDWSDFENEY